jgi:hypothetical protein
MDLPKLTRANQWDCRWCGTRYVIPLMARDCEEDHEAEEQEKAERETA